MALGLSERAVDRLIASRWLEVVESGVLAVSPVLEDNWGKWSGATLTAPSTFLSHASASSAWGFWVPRRMYETVTRPGHGGPRRHGGLLVFRSRTLDRRMHRTTRTADHHRAANDPRSRTGRSRPSPTPRSRARFAKRFASKLTTLEAVARYVRSSGDTAAARGGC